MLSFVVRRLLSVVPVLLFVAVLVFMLLRLVPGDPAANIAGDTATDWNFYSKRALLAGVYGATLLRFLEDRSDGCIETWAFLDRRIADTMRVPKAMAKLKETASRLPNPFAALRGGWGSRR